MEDGKVAIVIVSAIESVLSILAVTIFAVGVC